MTEKEREALRHAEAILRYMPQIVTNVKGEGPNTSTKHALGLVREALAQAGVKVKETAEW